MMNISFKAYDCDSDNRASEGFSSSKDYNLSCLKTLAGKDKTLEEATACAKESPSQSVAAQKALKEERESYHRWMKEYCTGKMVSRLTMWASCVVVRSLPFTCSLLFFNPSLCSPVPLFLSFQLVLLFIPTQHIINSNFHIYPYLTHIYTQLNTTVPLPLHLHLHKYTLTSSNNFHNNIVVKMSKEVSEEGHQPHHSGKDYVDPPPAPLLDFAELKLWSFYRALIAEFIATLLFLYVTVATVIGHKKQTGPCDGVGLLGIAWSFGGMIFVLVYCTAGISGGHINPAVTFGLFLARKVSLIRAVLYIISQCLGAICGVGLVKAFMKHPYNHLGGGANSVASGYTKGSALGAEIIGTFVLVYTVFSATDPKRSARDSHIPVLAPLPIGFAVFMVHLATIPITGTGINPARSFGAAVIFNNAKIWDDQWIFWVGPFVGAAAAAAYHQYILRAAAIKALGSFRSNPTN